VPDTIEAEVLEIDGRPAPPPREQASTAGSGDRAWNAWSSLRGRVVRLDRRWWPLWVALGILAVALIGMVACVVAVAFTMVKLTGGIVRFLTGTGRQAHGTSLVRRGG
jgi:hypothetical protein